MTEDTQKYLENFLDLFSMTGWEQLMTELEGRASAFSVHSIDDEKSLYKAKGELQSIANLLNFENYIRQSLDDMANQSTEGK